MDVVGLSDRGQDQRDNQEACEAWTCEEHAVEHSCLFSVHLLKQIREKSEVTANAEEHEAYQACKANSTQLCELDGKRKGNLEDTQDPVHLFKVQLIKRGWPDESSRVE